MPLENVRKPKVLQGVQKCNIGRIWVKTGKFTESMQPYWARYGKLQKEHGYFLEVLKYFVNISFMDQFFIKRLYKGSLI